MYVGSWDDLFSPVVWKMFTRVRELENMTLLLFVLDSLKSSLEKQNATHIAWKILLAYISRRKKPYRVGRTESREESCQKSVCTFLFLNSPQIEKSVHTISVDSSQSPMLLEAGPPDNSPSPTYLLSGLALAPEDDLSYFKSPFFWWWRRWWFEVRSCCIALTGLTLCNPG